MKRKALWFLLFLFIFISRQITIAARQAARGQLPVCIEEPAGGLEVGEKLVYAVEWAGVPSGYISLEVKEITTIRNRPVYHVVAKARPNKFFRIFHNVEHTLHSYIDMEKFRPLRFSKQRILNGKYTEETLDFFYEEKIAFWKTADFKTSKIELSKNPQDLLSTVYYFRLMRGVKEQDNISIDILYNVKIWQAIFDIRKIEAISLGRCGRHQTILISPVSDLTTHITGYKSFQTNLTIDQRRIPVLFKVRTRIGHIVGVLVSGPICKSSN